MRRILFTILCSFFTIFVGCGQKVPADWEKVYPCTITVTKDGAALDQAVVALSRTDKPLSYAVSGLTDANGVAVIHTSSMHFSQPGAPAGTFKVTVVKDHPPIVDPLSSDEIEKLSQEERDAHFGKLERERLKRPAFMPQKYTAADATPLEITVGMSGAAETYEVGK